MRDKDIKEAVLRKEQYCKENIVYFNENYYLWTKPIYKDNIVLIYNVK